MSQTKFFRREDYLMKRNFFILVLGTVLCLGWIPQSHAGVQYVNDFENPSDPNPSTAWPEWVDMSTGGTVTATNGRIEWSGSSNHWLRLNRELPQKYSIEFDFFYQKDINGRFSLWPLCGDSETDVFNRYNYFLRANTHFFNGADTIPSEGSCDLTLALGSSPHRLRVEVNGDHVVLLYKNQGQGGFIKIDERDFPAFGDGARYFQFGFNLDATPAGLIYADNFVLSYSTETVFSYENTFANPSSTDPHTAWPELVDMSTGGPVTATGGRIEWTGSGNHWLRLDKALPQDYYVEFDFFYQADINGRFSFWPLCGDSETDVFNRYNYFLRKNTHFFNGADTIPSEGPCDLTLPLGSNPHRLRAEVSGDHIIFLYKINGVGGFVKIDERDFPAFGDGARYIQFGFNLDATPAGLIYVDNLVVKGLSANRVEVGRDIQADRFEPTVSLPVSLSVGVSGTFPLVYVTDQYPDGWAVSNISDGGVDSNGIITWTLKNLSSNKTLTYTVTPPRLTMNRTEGFAGTFDTGDGEEPIGGDTQVSVILPYLYREAIDYDFSGSPVDGKNYPTGTEYAVRYTQGLDGLPSDVIYERPTGDDSVPAIDDTFVFPAGTDFHQSTPELVTAHGESYNFLGYRDEGEVWFEHGANDTNANLGSLDAGDWFRYTFDLGDSDQVLILNMSFNTWHANDNNTGITMDPVDVYVDNKFKGEIQIPVFGANQFVFYSVGPFEVSSGVHSVVVAFPGPVSPLDFGRMEVIRVSGIGNVTRTLTSDGYFDSSQPLTVTLKAASEYGTYAPVVEEYLPTGVTVVDAGNGQVDGNSIFFTFDPTTTSETLTYTIQSASGSRFLLFDGLYDTGLPLAETIRGDVSVTNEAWLFGTVASESKDEFTGSALASPWTIEYGSDPSLNTDYEEGVTLTVADGKLSLGLDTYSMADKFSEWENGRRAPLVLRTDIPTGDWRIETSVKLVDSLGWSEFMYGLFVAYNDGSDTNVAGDEYLFGFDESRLDVYLTGASDASGVLSYHTYTEESDWIVDMLLAGKIEAKLAVTRRSNELIFSAQLPDGNWQLLGEPVTETRTPTRLGIFAENWGSENYSVAEFEYFTLSALDTFTDVANWSLY